MTTTPPADRPPFKPNLAVYSTYCGTLQNLTFCARRYDHYPAYFITNNREVLPVAQANGWIPLFLDGMEPSDDPIVSATQAKLAKAMPHRFEVLSQYDFLFYTDDKYKLQETILPGLAASMRANRSPMAMKLHPWLKPNVLLEYTESLGQKRYFDQRGMMIAYISSQLMAGLKVQTDRHFTTNCILRDMRHPDIAAINETWYQHIQACGIECQVSFFFVAQLFPQVSALPDHHELCV
jgi:hypothetical protein